METDILNTDGDIKAKRRQSKAEGVVNLGLFANAVLAVSKLTTGILGRSQALFADGINSTADVVYFTVVKILVSLSGKPADDEHPYGHHQFESIAALVVGAFVITTGLVIFWNSVNNAYALYSDITMQPSVSIYALLIAAFSVAAKILLMMHAAAVAKKTGNIAVDALARDHRNDIFASAAAGLGILFGVMGYNFFDPAAGAVVAVIVIKTGVDILRESAADLMDSVPNREIDSTIRTAVAEVPDVIEVESVHAHRFGPFLVVNLTIGIDGSHTVAKGDKIADSVEDLLYSRIEMLRKVYIHYHPARGPGSGRRKK